MLTDWTERAACKGRGYLFFPVHRERDEARVVREIRAKRICAQCPVIERCRILGRGEGWGVWGGESESERGWVGQEYPKKLA